MRMCSHKPHLYRMGAYVQGADPWAVEAEGLTALHLACKHGHSAVISAILDVVPEQQRQRYMELATKAALTPLRLAIQSGSSEACKVLIRYGPSFHSLAPPAGQGQPKVPLILSEQSLGRELAPLPLSPRGSFPSSAKRPLTSSVILVRARVALGGG
jgi:ankyrin repeat protein